MKKIYITIIFTFLLIIMIMVFTGTTIVITTAEPEKSFEKFKKGDTVNVFEKLDFDKGKWCAYLVLSRSDFPDLNKLIPRRNCFKLEDINLMKQMKKEWRFIYTGGDLATVESFIIFYNDGKAVFESGIVLDQDLEGLQSSSFGWSEPVSKNLLTKYCMKFKNVYWPVLIL
jgi:hypothetical protein